MWEKSKSVKVRGKRRRRKRVSTRRVDSESQLETETQTDSESKLECHGVGQLPLPKGQRAEQGWAKKESKMRRRPPAGNKRETRTIKIQQQQQRHVENGLHNRSRGSTMKQTKQNKTKKKVECEKKLTHFKAKRRRGGAGVGEWLSRRGSAVKGVPCGVVAALDVRLFDISFDRLPRMSCVCANPLAANRARTSRGTNLISA